MNKKEFLKELNKKLKHLPENERIDAVKYYEEYFEDAQINEDIDVLCELSTPSEIASQILSEYSIKEKNKESKNIKTKISSIWFVLLAILVSPISLPITILLILVIIIGLFAIFLVGFVFLVVAASLIGSGVYIIFSGIGYIFTDINSTLISLGLGAIFIGISVLAIILIVIGLRKIFSLTFYFFNKILNNLK
ncbi:DUF1700 domain-containing protein [Paraclostridium sordellii]|uniref:DUF1700 domain-containing protein n=1 Tax=Paraclostridium sordellii TaxID=1505 RepID=UPI0005E74BCC|nr:DUF1700 domain-containing protein [Paeniclostridium sordellii]CEP80921.1 Predicted membrane protein [[Clostridium] sordellii] [Paeniclostridium sordellii]